MTTVEWKYFWDKVDMYAHEYKCTVYRTPGNGGWRVLLHEPLDGVPTTEQIVETGVLVTETRFGFRGDTGEVPYLPMIKVEWRAETGAEIPIGMSRTRIVYISQDPQAVFALLYA